MQKGLQRLQCALHLSIQKWEHSRVSMYVQKCLRARMSLQRKQQCAVQPSEMGAEYLRVAEIATGSGVN